MKPLDQQIAIAKECGWKDIRRPCDNSYHELPPDTLGFLMGRVCGIAPGGIHSENARALPDYLTDLNAIRGAAETAFTESTAWLKFVVELLLVCVGPGEMAIGDQMVVLCRATAAQWAEAFLRTLNKWTTQ